MAKKAKRNKKYNINKLENQNRQKMNNNSGQTQNSAKEPVATSQTTKSKELNGNRAFLWYLVSVVVVLIDQISKTYFNNTLKDLGNSIEVINPVLNWTLAYNYGAAFSFLADQGGWQKVFFAVLAAVISFFLVMYLRAIPRSARLLSIGLSLILGGAIGNLIDRVSYGYVIDFIHVHYENVWHYPIFNIADCAIMIGVTMMVIDMLFLEKKR